MKRILSLALFSLATLIALPTANAQGQLRAHIPFAFTVADTPMPAGEYTISSPTSGVIRLTGQANNAIATVAAQRNFSDRKGKSALIFNKYGNQYFLHGIVSNSIDSLNLRVPTYRREKRALSGEGVLVAAR